MIKIKVVSYIFGKTDLTGDYTIQEETTIFDFVQSLSVKWDNEALIVVNDKIVNRSYILQENDYVYFLTPIAGG